MNTLPNMWRKGLFSPALPNIYYHSQCPEATHAGGQTSGQIWTLGQRRAQFAAA